MSLFSDFPSPFKFSSISKCERKVFSEIYSEVISYDNDSYKIIGISFDCISRVNQIFKIYGYNIDIYHRKFEEFLKKKFEAKDVEIIIDSKKQHDKIQSIMIFFEE